MFKGNIAHHNIDDGWDLNNRTNEGANKPITLDGLPMLSM
ncbi:Pectate disaccharide-lyase [Neobacillus vireti LMG 21834]|uniref:Pectate disaccharide-lyase n=1 Tax=Neobacillus vireti LMG 21834 TaxID=1131730 RepID=A0AB94ISX3_9BACI|nr:Pectate disaccharide-lyase [Neobacillus vireti LMG 21834]